MKIFVITIDESKWKKYENNPLYTKYEGIMVKNISPMSGFVIIILLCGIVRIHIGQMSQDAVKVIYD